METMNQIHHLLDGMPGTFPAVKLNM